MTVLAVSLVPAPIALVVVALGTPAILCLFVAEGFLAARCPSSAEDRRPRR